MGATFVFVSKSKLTILFGRFNEHVRTRNQVALHFYTTVIPAKEEQIESRRVLGFTLCLLMEPRYRVCKVWPLGGHTSDSKKEMKSPLTILLNSGTTPAHQQPASLRESPTDPPARCDRQTLHWAAASSWLVAMGTVSRGGKAQAAQDCLWRKDGRQQWRVRQLQKPEFES